MPRLTFEALMAPGGLLDSGSRLTQTLIETPFKREQMRQGIREQELGRAEQKQLRADSIAREDMLTEKQAKREDERSAKQGRVGYYQAKAGQADNRYAAAMKQASDNFEKKMVAQIKATGAKEPQQEVMLELMKQASSNINAAMNNKDFASKFADDPTFFARKYKEAFEALNKEFGERMLTPKNLMNSTIIEDSGVDEQLIKELQQAAKESVGAWENLRKEVGAVQTRIDAREFMQNNGLTTETYGLPREQTARGAAPGNTLGAALIPPTGTKQPEGPTAPKGLNLDDEDDVPIQVQTPADPQYLQAKQLQALADAIMGPSRNAALAQANRPHEQRNAMLDEAADLPANAPARSPEFNKRMKLEGAAAALDAASIDPNPAAFDDALMMYFRNAGVPEDQLPGYLQAARSAFPAGPGTMSAVNEIAKREGTAAFFKSLKDDPYSFSSPQALNARTVAENDVLQRMILDKLGRVRQGVAAISGPTAGPSAITTPSSWNPNAR
jgi:hypothetical protein